MKSGVYKIVCRGRVYIGSAKNLLSRLREHYSALSRGVHYNIKMQRSWNKYGRTSFKFFIIHRCSDALLLEREEFFFNKYQAWQHDKGFNMTLFVSRSGYSLETLNKIQKNTRALYADPNFRLNNLLHMQRVASDPVARKRRSETYKTLWESDRVGMEQRCQSAKLGEYNRMRTPEQKAQATKRRLETMAKNGTKTRVPGKIRKDKS